MIKEKKSEATADSHNRTGQELWGVIFFASGLLILISLVSYLINPTFNILGPWLGTHLSKGLVFLFGIIPSLLFPAAIIYLGIIIFKGIEMSLRNTLFLGLFILEMCILLAIHNLPIITQENFFPPQNNVIGNLFTFLLHYVFGAQRFGPYFLFIFALLITIVFMFNINIRDVIQIIITSISRSLSYFSQKTVTLFNRPVQVDQSNNEAIVSQAVAVDKKGDMPKKARAAEGQAEPQSEEEETDESAQALEEELAAFRAKKNDPITILTSDKQAEEVEVLEEEVEEEEADIKNVAAIDPSLLNTEADEDEFCKVPTLEKERKKQKGPLKPYIIPDADILPDPPPTANIIDRQAFEENSRILERTLLNFGVEGKVVNISPGPVVTRYEIELAPGIKISKVTGLHDDISMAVGGQKIRIEAPIPGKPAVGIELPNNEMQIVYFKNILTSDIFRRSKAKLPLIIGRSIAGSPFVTDITKMPHMLIAGQTGSGKSVAINSLLGGLLMTKTPDELRLILIDPKQVEMSYYEHIPHLIAPVIKESKEAVKALQWGVVEMSRRYRLLARVHARNIDSFNQKIEEKSIKEGLIPENDNKKLPFIVIIVDELADLMLTASRDVEGLIQRIAQLARAVGIHLVVSTQRPSVDIITGPIKANLTSRIAFRTIQSNDSRTILDSIGAEKLLGRGDMLFLRSGAADIERYHGSFISEEDVEAIVSEIRSQNYETEKIDSFEGATSESKEYIPGVKSTSYDNGRDERFEEAARLIVSTGLGSTSLLQRRLKLGFARAGRLMDQLHEAGIVGPPEGSKAREVLVNAEKLEDILGS